MYRFFSAKLIKLENLKKNTHHACSVMIIDGSSLLTREQLTKASPMHSFCLSYWHCFILYFFRNVHTVNKKFKTHWKNGSNSFIFHKITDVLCTKHISTSTHVDKKKVLWTQTFDITNGSAGFCKCISKKLECDLWFNLMHYSPF